MRPSKQPRRPGKAAKLKGLAVHRQKIFNVFRKWPLPRRRREYAKLWESEEQYRQLVELSPEAIAVHCAGKIVFANRALLKLIGAAKPEELLGRQIFDFIHPGYHEAVRKRIGQTFRAGKPAPLIEEKFIRTDGAVIDVEVTAAPLKFKGKPAVQVVIRDITGRKRLEQEIARLERLNLVGDMAAGIGHEIRNPMTTVRGFLQLLKEKKECREYNSWFDLMIEELDRANAIITDFLSLAKNRPVDLKEQNLNTIVEGLFPLIRAGAMINDHFVQLKLTDVPDLPLDEKEIRQLVLNLARNGLEAMPAGGVLTIRTFREGEAVVLAVQDRGKGIEPHLLEQLGTPFFTTKAKGTGLGLAVCYSIAARHNAVIKVETSPAGTTFFVRFTRP